MKRSRAYYINMLQLLYENAESEINACYGDLSLIKNTGMSIPILAAILTYVGYSVKGALLGYATFSFFVSVFLFIIINCLAAAIAKNTDSKQSNRTKIEGPQLLSVKMDLLNQIIRPIISSMVLIYFFLFLFHALGPAYSGAGLSINTIFVVTSSGIVNFAYAISFFASAVSIVLNLRKDDKLSFMGYLVATALILITSILFVANDFLIIYPYLFSYPFLLAVVIEILLYFALIQYKYAIAAKLRIAKYKNELCVVKAKAEYLIADAAKGPINQNFYSSCDSLEIEYAGLTKPKLVIADAIPLLLQGYITIDMAEEVKSYANTQSSGLDKS